MSRSRKLINNSLVGVRAREDMMINYAMDMVEKQLKEGTASPSIVVHFLKLGSTRAEIEKLKLTKEVELLKAKKTSLDYEKQESEIFENAIRAMKEYGGEEL